MDTENSIQILLRRLSRFAVCLLFLLTSNATCLIASAQTRTSNPTNNEIFRFVFYRVQSFPFTMHGPIYRNIYSVTNESSAERQLTDDNHSFGPALSPDATTIAYVHIKSDTCEGCLNPPEYEIYLMSADGTDSREAATIDRPVVFSWSPDGKTLAYGGFPIANQEARYLPESSTQIDWDSPIAMDSPIYLLQVDGSVPPRLLTDRARGAFKWSPNGKWIAYNCVSQHDNQPSQRRVCISETSDKGEHRVLSEGAVPEFYSWSPDAARIAYFVFNKNTYTLFVARTDGSAPLALTEVKGFPGKLQWSPDSKQIAFAGREKKNTTIFSVGADGKDKKPLTEPKLNASRPMWSPDGTRLLFTAVIRDKPQVHLMNADGSNLRVLTHDHKIGCRNAAWLENSSFLLLRCGQPSQVSYAAITNEEFYILSADDRDAKPRQLTAGDSMGMSYAPLKLGSGASAFR